MSDLKYAFRQLLKNPGFTAVAVSVLALGIASTASLFALVKGLLLDPLPYPEPDRLAQVWTKGLDDRFDFLPLSGPDFLDLEEQVSSLDALGAFSVRRFNVGGARPDSVEGAMCTPGVFRALAVRPALGRWFTEEEGADAAGPAVILSHALWQQRLDADPDCIGKTLRLDGRDHTIVGVMPAEFELLSAWTRDRHLALWTLLSLPRDGGSRHSHWLGTIARLKPEISTAQAEQEVRVVAGQIHATAPDADRNRTFWLMPLGRQLGGLPALRVSVLLGAGWTLLVLAGQNVAGMQLARGVGRQAEIAVRLVLGARRGRIIRLVLMESLLLSGLACLAGFFLTLWCMQGLTALLPAEVMPKSGLMVDGWLLGCLVVLVLIATQMSGTAPALLASKTDVVSGLKDLGTGGGVTRRTHRRLRNLVVGQIALAVLLVSFAVRLADSYRQMVASTEGWVTDQVLTAGLAVKGAGYDDSARVQFWEELLAGVSTLPTVESAAVTTQLPLDGGRSFTILVDDEVHIDFVSHPFTQASNVSPDYFRAMGIRLLQGRALQSEDMVELWRHQAVVVNQAFADRYWPGQNPLGHHVRQDVAGEGWSAEVVGVVENVRQVAERPTKPEMYFPYADAPGEEAFLVVRAMPGFAAPMDNIREELRRLAPDLAFADPEPMAVRLAEASRVFTVVTGVVNGLTLAILVLAGIGLYGTLSFHVAQHRHDLGIRLALGAELRHVVGMVLRQSLAWVAAGLALGLTGAWALTLGLRAFVDDTAALDGGQLVAIVSVVALTALLASWLPVRRAVRLDPLTALRAD